MVIHLPKTINI